MNTLQFIASLVGSLAWPVAVVVMAVIFKDQIRLLTSRPVRRFRAGPVEMEFDRLLSEVEVSVERPTEAVAGGRTKIDTPVLEDLEEMANTSPIAAVMAGYAAIEEQLRTLARKAESDPDVATMGTARLLRLALDRGVITPETAKAVEGITVMRNLAAHARAGDVTAERARDYLVLADAVLYTLRQKPVP